MNVLNFKVSRNNRFGQLNVIMRDIRFVLTIIDNGLPFLPVARCCYFVLMVTPGLLLQKARIDVTTALWYIALTTTGTNPWIPGYPINFRSKRLMKMGYRRERR